jgi:hypothetical protein
MAEIEDIGNLFDFMSQPQPGEDDDDTDFEEQQQHAFMSIKDQLAALQVQSFLTLFGVYKSLPPDNQKMLEDAAESFVDPKQNDFVKQMALAGCCELLFPEPKEQEEPVAVEVKGDKVYSRFCGDCGRMPTKLVEFRTAGRNEEHYLCADCEETARKERT